MPFFLFYDILFKCVNTHIKLYTRVDFYMVPDLRLQVVEKLRPTEDYNHGGIKMSVISMKQLLEAGVHFGHQTRRWNPKMAEYIYTERNGIYIIDLQKSVGKVDEAYNAIYDVAAQGGSILFVGTKKQAQEAVKTEAERCGMYYVNERWLGGMLTNFKTIQSRIDRLRAIEITGKKVRSDLAMTGEITLRGRALPIGGLKEKLLAAKMAGLKEVLVPFENKKDVEEISDEIKDGMTITYVKDMKEVLRHALVAD